MYISLYTLYFNNLKFIKNFLFSIFYKNFFLIKNYSLLFFKIKYSLIIYYNNNYFKYLKNIIFFLNNFLQGFCFKLTLEGKKFKFIINNFHVFSNKICLSYIFFQIYFSMIINSVSLQKNPRNILFFQQ